MRNRFRFGRFELRADERVLLCDAAPLRLGGRAFDILLALVERRERLVEFDELLNLVWPGLAVEENNLSVQISTLRKLIGDAAITTVRGRGYRFTAQVVELPDEPDAGPPTVAGGALSLPTRQRGAVVALRLGSAGGLSLEKVLPVQEARVLERSDQHLVLMFKGLREAVRAALAARQRLIDGSQRTGPARCGRLGLVGIAEPNVRAPSVYEVVKIAMALAGAAGPNDIVAAAEVLGELVAGVDAEFEDLGELAQPDWPHRACRLEPPADEAARGVVVHSSDEDFRPRIAVLPLECLTGSDADGLLGEALAEDVIACLSRNPGLLVVSNLSSRRLRRTGLSFSNMAASLAAHYVLTGSYRQVANGVQIDVLIQEVRGGSVLHSVHCSARSLQEAFDPLSSVGQQVTREVERSIARDALARTRVRALPDLENHVLLLAAVELMHRTAPRDAERSHAMLTQLAQRPNCRTIASAWLAKWHVLRVVQGWATDRDAVTLLALDHVNRSLDEGAREPQALAIGGFVHAYLRKDLVTAGWMYEEAIDINPSEPMAWLFSATRSAYLGQGREAEQAAERALRLSPLDPLRHFFDSLAGTALLASGQWLRSLELSQRSIRANRTHASSWRTMTYALVMLDRMDEARESVRQLRAVDPGYSVAAFRERFPGRDGPMVAPWAEALQLAGLPA